MTLEEALEKWPQTEEAREFLLSPPADRLAALDCAIQVVVSYIEWYRSGLDDAQEEQRVIWQRAVEKLEEVIARLGEMKVEMLEAQRASHHRAPDPE